MSVEPRPNGVGEFALRATLGHGAGAWLAFLVPRVEDIDDVCSDVASAIELAADVPVQVLHRPIAAAEIAARARAKQRDALVVGGLEGLAASEWANLDAMRSRLQRTGSVVLVLTRAAAASLERWAPHLASWVGGSTWTWDPRAEELTDAERAERIVALEHWSGKTSEEIVFTITLKPGAEGVLDLDAYSFQLCYPSGHTPAFLRFNLDAAHEGEGLRAHLHPGANKLRVPTPLMHPLEMLELFIYGLRG